MKTRAQILKLGEGEVEKGSNTNWAPTMLSPSIYVPFSPYCIL